MCSALHKEDKDESANFRVLVVDENQLDMKLYESGLGDNFDVSFSQDVHTAWELLNSAPLPDAIIVDVIKQDEDGLELCNRMKETQFIQDVPIIFVAASKSNSVRSKAFDLGGADFIEKPLLMNELVARLRRHIALYRKTKKLESLIYIDPLTHLPNAAKFQEVLKIEWARCARYWHHLTLLVIRIDNLDFIRDLGGSDKYFSTIAGIAEGLTSAGNRPGDLVATLSNDKFAVLLSDCGHEGAKLKAKQIMAKFDNDELGSSGIHLNSTVGYAVAAPAGGGTPDALYREVDNLMLEAQECGEIYAVKGIIGVDE
ncbi:MAG: diguanylate cyclase (GGDEF)-like protein [Glaciecola sp.]|jgi:diguanylate cyclase (GGDEF)-like protein